MAGKKSKSKVEKKVNIKSFLRKGKRVKPHRRRQKLLAGAGLLSAAGIAVAIKNKQNIKKLLYQSKVSKGLPKNAAIPKKYSFDESNLINVGTANAGHFRKGIEFTGSPEVKADLYNMRRQIDARDLGRGNEPGAFFSYLDPETQELKHFVKFGAITGIPDIQSGRVVDLLIEATLPGNIDPRGINIEAFRQKVQTDEKLRSAVQWTEEVFGGRGMQDYRKTPEFTAKREEASTIIMGALKDIPALDKPNPDIIDIRSVSTKAERDFKANKRQTNGK